MRDIFEKHIYLKELIAFLEDLNPDYFVPYGFGEPMSYRGYYEELAFNPCKNVRIRDMLDHAKSALDRTFIGYKGGDYIMDDRSICWIAQYGTSAGDKIGMTILKLWEYCAYREEDK